MKKLYTIAIAVLILVFCFCMLPTEAQALTSEYYTYEVIDGEVIITGCDFAISGNITIPSTIGGYPVTSIGDQAFESCVYLTSITIPEGVTSIGDNAFCLCESLTSITIPDSVTSIGDGAFSYCGYLLSITIPEGVTRIGDDVFVCCGSLNNITIPKSVTSIGERTFSNCFRLTSITIPGRVASIGYGVFGTCSSLTSITIPNSVTSIDSLAFYSCDSLTDIYYCGTEEQWAAVKVNQDGNESIKNAVVHYTYEEPIKPVDYAILEGANVILKKQDNMVFGIRSAGDYTKFLAVYINNVLVDPLYYTAAEGSTIVTFKPEYLATLPEGKYEVEIKFTDGSAQTTFTVEETETKTTVPKQEQNLADHSNPETGVEKVPIVAAVLLLPLSAGGLVVMAIYRKRAYRNR